MISVLVRTSVIAFTGYVLGSSLLEPSEPDSDTHTARPKRFLLIKGKKDSASTAHGGSKQGSHAAGPSPGPLACSTSRCAPAHERPVPNANEKRMLHSSPTTNPKKDYPL